MIKAIIKSEELAQLIFRIRGQNTMVDSDLADLYGVETRVLLQSVRRNAERFPEDFMFEMTKEELEKWRSQIVISNPSLKMGLRRTPYVFTEQGVAMLSSVLRSPRAIQINIEIMRIFTKFRKIIHSNQLLENRLDELEDRYDDQFKVIFDAIRQIMTPTVKVTKRPIGFETVWPKDDN